MATGDSNDILSRIKALFPRGWFADASPIRDGLAGGASEAFSHAYGLLAYAKLQTRLATVSDGWLDLAAYDYFGLRFRRKANESDTLFRGRVLAEIFRPRNTRGAITRVITDLGAVAPTIIETNNPTDCGGWGALGQMGYGVAGLWGSQLLPYQTFVTVKRPSSSGIPNIAGFDSPQGGFGPAANNRASFGAVALIVGAVTDLNIYSAVDSVRAAGTTAWVKITN